MITKATTLGRKVAQLLAQIDCVCIHPQMASQIMSISSNTTITDEYCHYVIIHHNQELVNKVILQFEEIISNHKQFPWTVMESPSIIVDTLLNLTTLCKNSCKLITEMMNPALMIENIDSNDSRLILTFENEFVSFNHESMIDYGLKNFNKKHWYQGLKHPTCFVYLFNQFEASMLVETSKPNDDDSGSSSESDEMTESVESLDDNDISSDNSDKSDSSESSDNSDDNDNDDDDNDDDSTNPTAFEKEKEEFVQTYGFVTRFFISVFEIHFLEYAISSIQPIL